MPRRYLGSVITYNPTQPTLSAASGAWPLNQQLQAKAAGNWPLPFGDPYFNYTTLLLSSTSLSNANNNLFVDSSGAFNPISRNGNTTQGSFTPYGTFWSNYFDGSGDYLSTPANAAFDFGTGDFTLECWVYRNDSTGTGLFESRGGSAGLLWYIDGTNQYARVYIQATAAHPTSTITVPTNQWVHLAVTRSSGVVYFWMNGQAAGSSSISTSIGSTATLRFGASNDAAQYNGYLSNMRVVKGTAVYTANFTPPTTPLTAISGTSLLTCQSNRFRDASTNNFTITRNGDTRVTDFSPFLHQSAIQYNQSDITNWSGYFDGSGDYLQMPSNAAFAFGTGDYTIEGWIYVTVGGLDQRITWFSDDRHNIDINTSNQIFLYDGAIRTFGTVTVGTWNHFAVSRIGGTVSCYLNGVRGYNASETTNSSTRSMNIAANNAGNGYFNGYISNIRVVKGTGVYSGATITVPTTPLTAIANTSLLTLQNAAFTDNSTNNFVITPNGNTTVTGNSPFGPTGYWSLYGSTSQGATIPQTTATDLGAGSFTIECWVNAQAFNTFVTKRRTDTALTGSWMLSADANGYFYFLGVGWASTYAATTNPIPLNKWTHLAVSRSGTNLSMFVDGVRVYNVTDSYNYTCSTYTIIKLGGNEGGNYPSGNALKYGFTGSISNLRIVQGSAVYDPSSTTITVPTSPLTAISGTSLLTCQDATMKDNSTNNTSVSLYAGAAIQPYNPFYTSTIASNGGSMYFDGSGDYLAVPNAANLQFGTGNFTVECWFNSNVSTTDTHSTIIGKWGSGFNTTGDWALRSRFSSTNQVAVTLRYSSGWYDITTGISVNDGAWHHLAFVRENSTTLKIYVDGVLGNSRTISSSDIVGSSATLSIGGPAASASGEGPITGYVSNARITTGVALYTAPFTPTTSVLTPSGNTSLLVNGMNAGIYDATAINDMETVGNAQVTTAVSKYGGSSVYFDGSGDYLSMPANSSLIFSGSFTIEFWVNFSATPSSYIILFAGTAANTQLFITTKSNGTGLRFGLTGVAEYASATQTWSAGQWYHVALVRNGTDVKFYVNGTNVSDATYANSNTYSGILLIGGGVSGVPDFSGYMDDVRITNGYARYTANFTPPTAALPTY